MQPGLENPICKNAVEFMNGSVPEKSHEPHSKYRQ